MAKDLAYRFNWHDEPRDSFAQWSFITMISSRLGDEDLFHRVNEASDKGQNVEMRVTLNGIEVDAKHFIDRLESNFEHYVGTRAQELVEEIGFDEIYTALHDAEREATALLLERLASKGIELRDEERN